MSVHARSRTRAQPRHVECRGIARLGRGDIHESDDSLAILYARRSVANDSISVSAVSEPRDRYEPKARRMNLRRLPHHPTSPEATWCSRRPSLFVGQVPRSRFASSLLSTMVRR